MKLKKTKEQAVWMAGGWLTQWKQSTFHQFKLTSKAHQHTLPRYQFDDITVKATLISTDYCQMTSDYTDITAKWHVRLHWHHCLSKSHHLTNTQRDTTDPKARTMGTEGEKPQFHWVGGGRGDNTSVLRRLEGICIRTYPSDHPPSTLNSQSKEKGKATTW